ncbi:MAG TPA: CDP-alcohol phosphatidyltransferase family protein [Candidatus Bathyarchaeia archaeon]|nr:CDP-alcohol phosphatidyltransferase family protein [Candidatus Bathyarchaeia archaeon]
MQALIQGFVRLVTIPRQWHGAKGMLARIQYLVEGLFRSTATLFFKLGISPNGVTALGFLLTVASAALFATGLPTGFAWAACFAALVVGSYFDALDGAMARKYARTSKIGGIMDSVLDRLGEVAIFSGIAVGGLAPPLLCLWAISASLMVSYVRARVSVEGITLKGVGIAERPERLLVIFVATIASLFNRSAMYWAVFLIAGLASLTVAERLYKTGKALVKN